MSDLWMPVLQKFSPNAPERCVILDAWSSADEIARNMVVSGVNVPFDVDGLIRQWNERGSDAIIDTLPYMLNRGKTEQTLNPSGITMRNLFPDFCRILDRTEHFAIVLDPTREDAKQNLNVYFVGYGSMLIPERRTHQTDHWGFYMPQTVETIQLHERALGVRLSPQMKQMVLRANGSSGHTLPYFYPVEWLWKGGLAELYKDFWEEVDSVEEFGRLEEFVSLYEDGAGNEQGFFPDEHQQNQEYTIYDWNHETAQFTVRASSFGEWISWLLEQG